jgi:hypothetical protein
MAILTEDGVKVEAGGTIYLPWRGVPARAVLEVKGSLVVAGSPSKPFYSSRNEAVKVRIEMLKQRRDEIDAEIDELSSQAI